MNKYTITLNDEHLKVINAALINGTYGVVAPLINHITQQISEQNAIQFEERRDNAIVNDNE